MTRWDRVSPRARLPSGRWPVITARLAPCFRRGKPPAGCAWQLLQTAVLEEAAGAAEGELNLLARAVTLAAQYGQRTAAFQLVEQHEERSAARGPLSRLQRHGYRALRLAVELACKNYPAAERWNLRIDWRAIASLAWAVNLQLLLAVLRGRTARINDLLRSAGSGSRGPLGPFDRGNRLRFLGESALAAGRPARARAFFEAAVRAYAKDPAFDARIRLALAIGWMGTAHVSELNLDAAVRCFEKSMRLFKDLGHEYLYQAYGLELAQAYRLQLRFREAQRLHSQVIAYAAAQKDRLLGYHQALRSQALLAAAFCAVDANDRPRAFRLLRQMRATFRTQRSARREAGYQLARAAAFMLARDPRALLKARRALHRSETLFRRIGDGFQFGVAQVHLQRARLELLLREPEAALAEAARCESAAQHDRRRLSQIQNDLVLLRSRVLLSERCSNHGRLYEEVLRSLGLARSPATLFQVYANLYHYTWRLQDDLELTDSHLKQAHAMSQRLPPATFRRLCQEHLAAPVTRRMSRLFGGKIAVQN